MAVFDIHNKNSVFKAVELVPSDGNSAYFHLRDPNQKEAAGQWLASIGQTIKAETTVGGDVILVTGGGKTQSELVQALEARGDKLTPHKPKIPFTEKAWQMGATLALVGQLGQLVSGFLRPTRKTDWAQVGLAAPNLLATAWILGYGAQKSEDVNRLEFNKKGSSERIGKQMPDGGKSLPDIHEKRAELHKEPEKAPTLKEKLDDFLTRYSVVGGEIMLRYLGAFSLAFNVKNWGIGLKPKSWMPDQWGGALKELKSGDFAKAYQVGRTAPAKAGAMPLTHYAGLASLAGKSVALASQAPDTYSTKPKSWIDTLREKVTFRLGGWIETVAFAAIAVDGFMNKQISLRRAIDDAGKPIVGGGKITPDYISGIGGTLFTIRYVMRHWAPFGVKETNMDELYAHVTDSLAKLPQNKLAEMTATEAAKITENFKDKRLNFSDVHSRLVKELYTHNHVPMPSYSAPATQLVKGGPAAPKPAILPRKPSDRVTVPSDSHADMARLSSTGLSFQPGVV